MKINIRNYKVKNGKQLYLDINHQGVRKRQNLDGLVLTGDGKLDSIIMSKAEAYKVNYMKTYNPATILHESHCTQINIIESFNQFRDQYPYDSQKGKINGLRDSFVKFINSLGLDENGYYINMPSPIMMGSREESPYMNSDGTPKRIFTEAICDVLLW